MEVPVLILIMQLRYFSQYLTYSVYVCSNLSHADNDNFWLLTFPKHCQVPHLCNDCLCANALHLCLTFSVLCVPLPLLNVKVFFFILSVSSCFDLLT